MIDDEFSESVARLAVPAMGTENVGPLLYWLVRMQRPLRVLEVGMGYTTPFLAKAIADNVKAFEHEQNLLASGATSTVPKAFEPYYTRDFDPALICIDTMADRSSSAGSVSAFLDEQGLNGHCRIIESDLRGSAPLVSEIFSSIDFAWIDTWNTLAFLREYWNLLSAKGGMLAVHYLMTYPQGRAVQKYLKSLRGPDGGRLEIVNLLEPHKHSQNSLTLLRRVRDFVEPYDLRPDGDANDPTDVLSSRGSVRSGSSEQVEIGRR